MKLCEIITKYRRWKKWQVSFFLDIDQLHGHFFCGSDDKSIARTAAPSFSRGKSNSLRPQTIWNESRLIRCDLIKYSVRLSRWKGKIKDFAYLSDVVPVSNEPYSPVADVAQSEFTRTKKLMYTCLFSVVLARLKHYNKLKMSVFYSPKWFSRNGQLEQANYNPFLIFIDSNHPSWSS